MRKITFKKTEQFNPCVVLANAIGAAPARGYTIGDIKTALDLKRILEDADADITVSETQWVWLKTRFSEQQWAVAVAEIVEMERAISEAQAVPG